MSAKAAAAQGPWLILAPHPDDETLGCGALIAAISASGGRAHTAFVTDGAGSHPDAPGWSRMRIAGLRRTEAAAALRLLGGEAPLHLDWPDAAPPKPGDPLFERTADRLAAWCRARDIRRIAAGVVAGAAEQQASVSRQPVVIQADFLVAQRQVLRDQLVGHIFR